MYLGQKRLNEKHTVASVPDCHRLGFHAEIQIIFGTVCRVLDLQSFLGQCAES